MRGQVSRTRQGITGKRGGAHLNVRTLNPSSNGPHRTTGRLGGENLKAASVGFRTRKQHLVIDGKAVPWSKTHEAIRSKIQERNQAADPQLVQELSHRPQLRPQLPRRGNSTLEELQRL